MRKMPSSTATADAAREKVREGHSLDRDDLFALRVAAEFDLSVPGRALSPPRLPRFGSMAALEDLNGKQRVLEDAKAAEKEVRSEMVALRRELDRARARGSMRQAEEERRHEAQNQRLYMAELRGSAVLEVLASNAPATEDEATLCARILTLRAEELYEVRPHTHTS